MIAEIVLPPLPLRKEESFMARKFSDRTMAICGEILSELFSDGELQNFLSRFGLLDIYRRLPQGTGKLKRIQEVIAYLNQLNNTENKDKIWDDIVIETVKTIKQIEERAPVSSLVMEKIRKLEECLALDGYQIENGKIIKALPASTETIHIRDRLEQKLLDLGWFVPLQHLQDARENYAEERWAAANASIRSFLQAIFDNIAEAMSNFPKEGLVPGGARRQFLETIGFLTKEEAELVRALFKILATKGSHPGLSDESDCSSRILMSIGIAWRFLSRFLEKGGNFS